MKNIKKLINLTPHDLWIFCGDKPTVIPASGSVARLSTSQFRPVGEACGVPVCVQAWGEIVGLPEPQDGVCYIVSGIVLAALDGARPDVLTPDTGLGAVRDGEGRVVGTKRLIQEYRP